MKGRVTLKKVISITLLISVLLSLTTLSVFSEGQATVTVSVSSVSNAKARDIVTVIISISDCPMISSIAIIPQYDNSVFEFVGGEWLLSGALIFDTKFDPASSLIYASPTDINGDIMSLKYKVKDGTLLGNYSVGCTIVIKNGSTAVSTSVEAGTITVVCPHSNTTNIVAVPSTCKDTGFTAGVFCNDCDTYISGHEVITKTNTHTYGDCVKIDDAKHKHTCSVCNYVETVSHKWNSGTVTKQPTHTAFGAKAYTCVDCGASKTEQVAKLTEHTYGEWTKYNETQHKKTCACGDVQYANHNWDAGIITTPATNESTGIITYTCQVCGEVKTEIIPKVDHVHIYGSVWKHDSSNHWHECSVCGTKKDEASHAPGPEATETTPQVCEVCNYEIMPATWHIHSFSQMNTNLDYLKSAATCTAKAVYYYSCICGEKGQETFDSGDYAAHNYKIEFSNDETNHWHECSVCGLKADEAAHSFEWKTDKVATVTEKGSKHEECETCGYQKTTVSVDKLAPNITEGDGSKWQKGNGNILIFKSDAAFADFVEVIVDGKVISSENYSKREGGIIVELKESYLETLSVGEHTLIIRSDSGDATAKFTVEAEIKSSATGLANVWIWIIISTIVLGIVAMVVILVISKRKTT